MREPLALHSQIDLHKNNGEHCVFTIEGIAGEGANFIVYDASYLDEFKMKSHIRLKECFPLRYAQPNRAGKDVIWDNEEAKKQAFSHLEYVYKRQKHLQEQTDFVNTSSHIEDDIYYGNNTGYLMITRDVAQTFQKTEIKDLQRMLKILLHLSETIGTYHSHGLLHLDLKPENFMVLDKTEEIKLIDFDSFISTKDVKEGILQNLSYTNSWAAPEVKQGKYRQIGTHSDVYSIGTILFYGLFQRPMEAGDILMLEALNLENHPLLENLNPAIRESLEHFLRKCLEPSVRLRYQNTEELCKELEQLIPLADPKALFLCSSIPEQLSYFTGRQKELSDIHALLKSYKMVLINGIGGIGKSEFSKYYAHNYRDSYTQVVWFKLESTVAEAFCDGKSITIANYDASNSGNDSDKKTLFAKKLQTLKGLVTKDTLFIIDDVRDFTDKDLLEVLKLDCKFLLTSRKNPRELFAKEKIYTLGSLHYSSLEAIFLHHYSLSLSKEEQELLPKLFEKIGNYTLLIPILAKLMQMRSWTPSLMLTKLADGGLTDVSKDLVASLKDDEFVDTTMYLHVKRLFNLSDLTDAQKKVLSILSWLENLSISRKQLQIWCGEEEDYSVTQILIRDGWVQHEERLDLLSVHNVIGDVLNEEIKLNIDEVPVFREYVMDIDPFEIFQKGILAEKVLQHICVTIKENFHFVVTLIRKHGFYGYITHFSKLVGLQSEELALLTNLAIHSLVKEWCAPWDEQIHMDCVEETDEKLLQLLQKALMFSKQISDWHTYINYEDYWTQVLELNKYHSLFHHIYLIYEDVELTKSNEFIRNILLEISEQTQDTLLSKRIDCILQIPEWWKKYKDIVEIETDDILDYAKPSTAELSKIFDDIDEHPCLGYDTFVDSSKNYDFMPIPKTELPPWDSSAVNSKDLFKKLADIDNSMQQKKNIHPFIISLLNTNYPKQYLIEELLDHIGGFYGDNNDSYMHYLLVYFELCEKKVFGTLSITDYAYLKLEKAKLMLSLKHYRSFFRELQDLLNTIEQLIFENDNNLQGELEHILLHTILYFSKENWYTMGINIYITFFCKIPEEHIINKDGYSVILSNIASCSEALGCRELLYSTLEKQIQYTDLTFFNVNLQLEDKFPTNCFSILQKYVKKAAKAKTNQQWQYIAQTLTQESDLDEKSLLLLNEACAKEDDPARFIIRGNTYDSFIELDKSYCLYLNDIYRELANRTLPF